MDGADVDGYRSYRGVPVVGGPLHPSRVSDNGSLLASVDVSQLTGTGGPVTSRMLVFPDGATKTFDGTTTAPKDLIVTSSGAFTLFSDGGWDDREKLRKVEGKVLFQDGNVYLEKRCPEHGRERVLVADDIEYYKRCREVFVKPPEQPLHNQTPIRYGCPYDCGLCPDHEQHGCLTIVEVTDQCNLTCPVCYADSSPHRPTRDRRTCATSWTRRAGRWSLCWRCRSRPRPASR